MDWNLGSVENIEITAILETTVDGLYVDPPGVGVKRMSLGHGQNPFNAEGASKSVVADSCSAMCVDIFTPFGTGRTRLLFDCGGNPNNLLANMAALDIEPKSIDQVIISHGHPDHLGGIKGFMDARDNIPCPIVIHPATYSERYIISPHGFLFPHITSLMASKKECVEAGARFVETVDPIKVGPAAMTTGNIPWNSSVPFEPSPITLYHMQDHHLVLDKTPDEMALIVNLEDHGLVVLSGCSHNGIINTALRAKEVTGIDKIYAVIGGFHLGFPEVPDEMIDQTIESLKGLNLKVVLPMHCTGFKATAAIMNAMPDEYVQSTTGMRISLPFPKHNAVV